MKYRNLGKQLLAGLAITASGSTMAASSAVDELLKALYQNGTIDKATYELVQQTAKAEEAQNQAQIREISVAESKKTAGDVIAKSKASQPTVTMGGKIQLDAGGINEDIADHNNGTEIRRARFFAKGTLHEDWAYKLQYEFASSNANIDGILDAFIDYKPLNIRIGHFEEPFSLQNMTSDKYLSYNERAMSNIFTEGRNIGVQHSRSGDNWSLAGGIFGDGRKTETSGNNNEGWGVSARATIAPINEADQKLHLGVSAGQRYLGGDKTINFSERPETHITNSKIVNTDPLNGSAKFSAESLTRGALEAAFVNGPWHASGEYYLMDINRGNGFSDVTFSGYYVESGLFLTNDSMNYSANSGKFGKITPSGQNGAWQIAARFSSIDLNDNVINGGEADSLTLGLNWFATPNIRFSANYINILDVDGGPAAGDNPEAFTLRSQVEF